jgi:hypothetical protein
VVLVEVVLVVQVLQELLVSQIVEVVVGDVTKQMEVLLTLEELVDLVFV